MSLARLFVERRQVAWVALVATLLWGGWAYTKLPRRKDPEVTIKTAVVSVAWPGADAQDVEALVTRPIELVAAQVPRVDRVTSSTRAGLATIFVTLDDGASRAELESAWADLRGRLDLAERTLPQGCTPAQLNTRFGDTATVTLTVASGLTGEVELELRAAALARAVERHRAGRPAGEARGLALFVLAEGVSEEAVSRTAAELLATGEARGLVRDGAVLREAGLVALDHAVVAAPEARAAWSALLAEPGRVERPHPDVLGPIELAGPAELLPSLRRAELQAQSPRALDRATELLRDELARLPGVSRVDRHGVIPERVHVLYSQERLASFGLSPGQLVAALRARNPTTPAGQLSTGEQRLLVQTSGALASERELLDATIATAKDGTTLRLRDVAELHRSYETPVSDAAFLTFRDERGWHRTRAVSLAIQARSGEQVEEVGRQVDEAVARVARELPPELLFAKTSDQPELVSTRITEFLRSLLEAVVIVVAIALVFMERRSALLVAASIPLSLAMTFGLMQLLGLDLQQVSIASLIIALGLLVDDPVIASDAINRELAKGVPRERAAWQGPDKLAKAIFFATATNVVAFAPLLLVQGSMGEFIRTLPLVVTLALVSSRVVSMTFMPLLGFHLLRGQAGFEAALEGTGRAARLARAYNDLTVWMLEHRGWSFAGFALFLVLGLAPAALIRTQFFPEEAMTRFYVHVRLPEGSDVRATERAVQEGLQVILRTEGERLERVTSYVGNGGPRWWGNVGPEPKNPAYALLIVEAKQAEETMPMIGRLERVLRAEVAGARFQPYRTSSGRPGVTPVEVRVSGPDPERLRALADEVKGALLASPATDDVFDDWGGEALVLGLEVDEARTAAAGLTHGDVAGSALLALSGQPVTQLREADRVIDVSLRLRPSERASAAAVQDLYVWGARGGRPVPLRQVADAGRSFGPPRIVRYDQQRTITIGARPKDGELASRLLQDAAPALAAIQLPPGYALEQGGEAEQQATAFGAVSIALKVSIALTFLVLVWQFASVFKPLVVFAAIPFGLVGVVLGLVLTGTNFGFMAFLGVASLIGVIVSHIIVLFDFIEEAREEGAPLHRAVVDAGLVRLRPVLVTVLATVGGLIPLALEGGPMWRQLVWVQIGGLLLATVVTKGVVPLLYVFFVEKLRLIEWAPSKAHEAD